MAKKFRDTMLGRILTVSTPYGLFVKRDTVVGKVQKVAWWAGTAVALPGVAGLTGVSSLFKKAFQGAKKVIDPVSEAAADLVSGVTKEQREMITEVKDEARVDEQKLRAIEKLLNAGDTVEAAAAKVGVSLSALAGLFGVPSEASTVTAGLREGESYTADNKILIYAGLGLAGLLLLPNLLKGRR